MSSRISYDPSQFLELADKLVPDNRYEEVSRSRTAIGRAYYSAFLMAKKKLEDLGYSFHEPDILGIHQQVIEKVLVKDSTTANRLETLRRYRIDADYKMETQINSNIGRICVNISRTILRSLSQLK